MHNRDTIYIYKYNQKIKCFFFILRQNKTTKKKMNKTKENICKCVTPFSQAYSISVDCCKLFCKAQSMQVFSSKMVDFLQNLLTP